MSPDDLTELIKLLLAAKEQQNQNENRYVDAAFQGHDMPSSNAPADALATPSLTQLAQYLQSLEGRADVVQNNETNPKPEQDQPKPTQQNNRKPSHQQQLQHRVQEILSMQWQNMTAQQLEECLLSSFDLLREINSNLADTVVSLAMKLPRPASSQEQQQLQLSGCPQAQRHYRQHSDRTLSTSVTNQIHRNQSTSLTQQQDQPKGEALSGESSQNNLPISSPDEATLQGWSLQQIEAHVDQLQHACQPIPKHIALALFNKRRSEEKRNAKRLANHKWATKTKAKERKLFSDMMNDYASLLKTATILDSLPDLVVSIDLQGEIQFCGIQVENVLKYKVADLVGSNIEQVIVPESRGTVRKLIQDLVITRDKGRDSSSEDSTVAASRNDVSNSSNDPCLKIKLPRSSDERKFNENSDDSSSSPSGKRRRLVPIYKVCFIRNDLTTIWCEITGSFCSGSMFKNENAPQQEAAKEAISKLEGTKSERSGNSPKEEEEKEEEEDTLLICIRPTVDGTPVHEDCRFIAGVTKAAGNEEVAAGVSTSTSANDLSGNASSETVLGKRPFEDGKDASV